MSGTVTAAAGSGARVRIDPYVVAAFALAALVASVAVILPGGALLSSTAVAVPPSLLFGFMALAAKYGARAMPLRTAKVPLLVATHAGGGVVAALLWTLAWRSWLGVLERAGFGLAARSGDFPALLVAVGTALYLTAVVVHYLLAEVDAANDARQAALRYQIFAREAELRALKAQIDPHFLYNSLNAVAALCGSSPAEARRMSQLLAEFFRLTVRLAGRDRIPLRDEIELARRYLEIEKIRFGSRLQTAIEADPPALDLPVPSLLLQPLAENAVRHGVGSIAGAGTVQITARLDGDALRLCVTNPADPDRARSTGEGIGLANVRGRLENAYQERARVSATEADGRFTVEITIEGAGQR